MLSSTIVSASIKSVCRSKFNDAVSGLSSSNLQTICATNVKSVANRTTLVVMKAKKLDVNPAIITKGNCPSNFNISRMHKVVQGIEINVCSNQNANPSNKPSICRNEFLNNVIGLSYSTAKSVCKKDPIAIAAWLNPIITAIYALSADRDDLIDHNLTMLDLAKTVRDNNMNSAIYRNTVCPSGTNEILITGDPQPMDEDGNTVDILHVCKEITETITVDAIQEEYQLAQSNTLVNTGVILPVGTLSTAGILYLSTPTALFEFLTPLIGLRSAETIAFQGVATSALATGAVALGVGVIVTEAILINRIIQLGKTRKIINQSISGDYEKEFEKAHAKLIKKLGCNYKSESKQAKCVERNKNQKLKLPGLAIESSKLTVEEFITVAGFAGYIKEITLNRSILNIKRKRNGKAKVLTINTIIRKISREDKVDKFHDASRDASQ
jgi:hypothetical protein